MRKTNPISEGVLSVRKGKTVVWASNFTLYTSNSAEGRSCKTKPICQLRPPEGTTGGAVVQNEANFRPSGRRERSGIHHSTPATRAASGDCFFPPGGYSVPYSMGPSPSHELRRAT